MSEISYQEEFEELRCIGRGNFGAAFLVKHKNPPEGVKDIYFIAKKIVLGQLQDKEQEAAHLEANLLRNLSHANIVSYKTSFIDKDVLIIIMEFCEMGDLAYHVKKKRSKEEHFSETEIMNWFVQMCLALEYVHGRKILHRDLKSQNIFLTANNTIKLGDFGISKVLENTNDQAMTVQGTPYYMSPEVCQSKPYTYSSDVWALGCILYELCTLKHAFSSENLLGLVFKIVQDKQEPIPDMYSNQMKDLVNLLLNKDAKKRPKVIDILRVDFVQGHMRKFVESQGKINLNPTIKVKKQINPTAVEAENAKQESTLTPAELMQRRRAERAQKEFERLAAAAKHAGINKQVGKELKQQEFHGVPATTISSFGGSSASGTVRNMQGQQIGIGQLGQGNLPQQQQMQMMGLSGSLVPNDKPAQLEQTGASDFSEVNNRTMSCASQPNDTLRQASKQSNEGVPKTDQGWYPAHLQNNLNPQMQMHRASNASSSSVQKDYLRETKNIFFDMNGGFDDFTPNNNGGELPSSQQLIADPNAQTNQFSSKANLQKFNETADRSDFGFSQASSQFSAHKDTIRQQAGIMGQSLGQSQQQRTQAQQNLQQQMYGQFTPGRNMMLQGTGSSVMQMEDSTAFQLQESLRNQQIQSHLLGTNQGSVHEGDTVLQSFLTMSGSQSIGGLGSRKPSNFQLQQSGILSPIMERTMESNQTPGRTTFQSEDERKLTGVGFYDLDKVVVNNQPQNRNLNAPQQQVQDFPQSTRPSDNNSVVELDEEDDYSDNYEDDFESDESEDLPETKTCTGGTSINVQRYATMQDRGNLDAVVSQYERILEMTNEPDRSGFGMESPSNINAAATATAGGIVPQHQFYQHQTISDSGFTQYQATQASQIVSNKNYGNMGAGGMIANALMGDVEEDSQMTVQKSLSHGPPSTSILPMRERIEAQKEQIKKQMGGPIYDKVYKILVMHKEHDTDPEEVQEALKVVTSKSKKLKDLCFALENLVWAEGI